MIIFTAKELKCLEDNNGWYRGEILVVDGDHSNLISKRTGGALVGVDWSKWMYIEKYYISAEDVNN